jgi:hypothetical protein
VLSAKAHAPPTTTCASPAVSKKSQFIAQAAAEKQQLEEKWAAIVPAKHELFSIDHDGWERVGLPRGIYVCLDVADGLIQTKDRNGKPHRDRLRSI